MQRYDEDGESFEPHARIDAHGNEHNGDDVAPVQKAGHAEREQDRA